MPRDNSLPILTPGLKSLKANPNKELRIQSAMGTLMTIMIPFQMKHNLIMRILLSSAHSLTEEVLLEVAPDLSMCLSVCDWEHCSFIFDTLSITCSYQLIECLRRSECSLLH